MTAPASALFASMASAAFATVQGCMGVPATWTPEAGAPVTALVLWVERSDEWTLAAREMRTDRRQAEWPLGAFPGLEGAVRDGSDYVTLTVEGATYQVAAVEVRSDGLTVVGQLRAVAA